MFAVTVTFRLKPGRLSDFLPLMRENATASLRLEPACHQFDVATDPDRPDEVFLYEVYADSDAFDVHRGMEHFKTFDSAVAQMVAGKDVRTYREVEQ